MIEGGLAIVLHAHLPFVRHSERDDVLEERWLFEAITESYIPLLEVLSGLARDAVPVRLTISLSPSLLGMLSDRLLRTRYLNHLDRLVELAEREERRTRHQPTINKLARMYFGRFCRVRTVFLDEWQRDLVAAFRAFQDQGLVEVITSAATHGCLPLLSTCPGAVRAQVEVAIAEYGRFFGGTPRGFWLPECAYEPGIDADLARVGVRYFVVDTHGVAHATPRPVHGVYAPIVCDSGVAAFGRDPDSVKQVWSAEEGFRGDPWYRDSRRDIGLELDLEQLAPHLPPDQRRVLTGIKYHRITGSNAAQELYDPDWARGVVQQHAAQFVEARRRQAAWLAEHMDRPPIIVCPFDAELFGRGWFEGPQWLDQVLRRVALTPGLAAITPSDDLERHPTLQHATPASSTWGGKGYHESWLSPSNDWAYRHLHVIGERLHALCRRYPSADERTRRALTQALRELLLAQSSDWALMMSMENTADYAAQRTRDHLLRCQRLCDEVESGSVDDLGLASLEDTDNIFPALDYRVLL